MKKNKKKSIRLMFTGFWTGANSQEIQNNPIYRLLEKHYNIILTGSPDFLIYSRWGREYQKYNCVKIFYTGENIRPNFSQCDYAFSFDYPVSERNYRLPLYRLYDEYQQVLQPRDPDKILSENRKNCCFLASNPEGKERIEFMKMLSGYIKVDSGGSVLNNIGYQVRDKLLWLQNYKFSIAFENSQFPGYTTEKLMHALISNTIPIYWGNPVVSKDFNTKAFINCHDYKSFDDVIDTVIMTNENDSIYYDMLNQPFMTNNIENEFCREENIVDRFDHIFFSKRTYLSHSPKLNQRLKKIFHQIIEKTGN